MSSVRLMEVGNEAAKPKYCQCREFGSSTSPVVLPPLATNSPWLPVKSDEIAIAYIYQDQSPRDGDGADIQHELK